MPVKRVKKTRSKKPNADRTRIERPEAASRRRVKRVTWTPNSVRILELRERAGMTQEELAAKAKVGLRTITTVEMGVPCLPRQLLKIKEALGCVIDEIKVTIDSETSYHPARFLSDWEFEEVVLIDANAYPRLTGYQNSFLAEWWKTFPRGCIAFLQGSAVAGGIGMWPLVPQWAAKFRAADITSEADIPAAAIQAEGSVANWYLAAVLLRKMFQHKGLWPMMIEHCLIRWIDSCRNSISEPFEVIISPVRGVRDPSILEIILERLGFEQQPGLIGNKHKIFTKEFETRRQFERWLKDSAVPLLKAPRKRIGDSTAEAT